MKNKSLLINYRLICLKRNKKQMDNKANNVRRCSGFGELDQCHENVPESVGICLIFS